MQAQAAAGSDLAPGASGETDGLRRLECLPLLVSGRAEITFNVTTDHFSQTVDAGRADDCAVAAETLFVRNPAEDAPPSFAGTPSEVAAGKGESACHVDKTSTQI